MKKLSLLWTFFLLYTSGAWAQEAYKYNEFYYQRATLFDVLPVSSEDIIFLGNSLTNGCEWHELFNNAHVKNRGISSDVIQGVYDRLNPVIKGKPRKIFLMIGVNDISHDLSVDSIVDSIDKIVRKIRKETPNTQLYVQSLLPTNDDFGRYKKVMGKQQVILDINERLKSAASGNGYTYIDLYSHFVMKNKKKMNPDFTNDGLHLLGPAYLVWKEVLLPYMK